MRYTLIIIFSIITLAQDSIPRYYFGLGFSRNFVNHTADFQKLSGTDNCCSNFNGGNGSGFEFGVLFRHSINKNLFFEAKFNYNTFNGDLSEKSQSIGNTELLENNLPSTQPALVDYNLDAVFQSVRLRPHLSHRLLWDLFFDFGLNLDIMFSNKFSQNERLITPNGYVFQETGQLTRNVVNDQEIQNLNTFQYGVLGGLSYQIALKNKSLIVPELNYTYRISDVSNVSWNYNDLTVGLAYKYPFYKKVKKQQIFEYYRDTNEVLVPIITENSAIIKNIDTIKNIQSKQYLEIETISIYESYEQQILKVGKFETNIEVYGIAEDGSKTKSPKLIFEEIETVNAYPLLPYVYYKKNSTELLDTKLSDKQSFKLDTLNTDSYDIYRNNMNIIASRIKEKGSSLEIVGINYNSPINIVERRVEDAKQYFIEKWGIDENDIVTSTRKINIHNKGQDFNDLEGESNRIELVSNDDIFRPVILSSIERKSNPPQIDMIIDSYSNLGIKEWNLVVRQNQNVLRSYSGDQQQSKKSWNVLQEPYPTLNQPIEFALVSEDIAGNQDEIIDSINLELLTINRKRQILKDDKIIENYSLIVFDYDKAELKTIHKSIINDIKSSIKNNSTITINGYSDRIGSQDYNFELSSRRVDNVAKEFEGIAKNIIKNPIGNAKLIYDNNLPQGRSLSRTVQIKIETPIE